MRKLIDLATDFLGPKFGYQNVNLAKQFIKFCMVGVTNLLVHLAVYFLITRFLHWYYLLATILAFVVAVSWSFFINRVWTFRAGSGNKREQYIKFFASNVLTAIFNIAVLYSLVEFLAINDLVSQLIASVLGAFVNFSINRFWTFRD